MTNAVRLGFIGLGSMGSAMAARLLDAGHALTVFDTNPAAIEPLASKGAAVANGAAKVASDAEIILGSLPTPDMVRDVAVGAGGVIKGAKDGSLLISRPPGRASRETLPPRLRRPTSRWWMRRSAAAVPAPCRGSLAVMVAAPRPTYEEVQNILKVFGKVFYVGEKAGLAQTMKLVNNMLSVAALAITSEGMVMGVKAGRIRPSCWTSSMRVAAATAPRPTNFRAPCCRALSTLVLRPACQSRISGFVFRKPTHWECPCRSVRWCSRYCRSPTLSTVRSPISRLSVRQSSNGEVLRYGAVRTSSCTRTLLKKSATADCPLTGGN